MGSEVIHGLITGSYKTIIGILDVILMEIMYPFVLRCCPNEQFNDESG